MSDEELISYYLHYRPELLEDIYQGLKDRFAAVFGARPVAAVPATQRTVILQEAVEEEAAPPVVVPPKPVPGGPADGHPPRGSGRKRLHLRWSSRRSRRPHPPGARLAKRYDQADNRSL